MDFVQEHPLITLWVVWIMTIPLGPVIGTLAQRRWNALPTLSQRVFTCAALISIGIALLTIFTAWSLRGFWANAVNLALAYVAVWVLCSRPYERAEWFRKAGRILVAIPSVLLAVCIYTAIPFFGFTDGMVPTSVEEVKPGIVARISQFGWETMNTDIVELVHRPRWFPVIEHSIHKWVNSNDTCGLGKIRVYAQPNSDLVVSTCSNNPLLTDTASIR